MITKQEKLKLWRASKLVFANSKSMWPINIDLTKDDLVIAIQKIQEKLAAVKIEPIELKQQFTGIKGKEFWQEKTKDGYTMGLWAAMVFGYVNSDDKKLSHQTKPQPRLSTRLAQWSDNWSMQFINELREFLQPRVEENDLKKFRSLVQLTNFRHRNGVTQHEAELRTIVIEAFERLPHLCRMDENGFLSTWIIGDNSSEKAYLAARTKETQPPNDCEQVVKKWFDLVKNRGMPLFYLNELLLLSKNQGWAVKNWRDLKKESAEIVKLMRHQVEQNEVMRLEKIVAGIELAQRVAPSKVKPKAGARI